jgi:hypothetical protein
MSYTRGLLDGYSINFYFDRGVIDRIMQQCLSFSSLLDNVVVRRLFATHIPTSYLNCRYIKLINDENGIYALNSDSAMSSGMAVQNI